MQAMLVKKRIEKWDEGWLVHLSTSFMHSSLQATQRGALRELDWCLYRERLTYLQGLN